MGKNSEHQVYLFIKKFSRMQNNDEKRRVKIEIACHKELCNNTLLTVTHESANPAQQFSFKIPNAFIFVNNFEGTMLSKAWLNRYILRQRTKVNETKRPKSRECQGILGYKYTSTVCVKNK